MRKDEIAWAAGLFEGEGCIIRRIDCVGAFQLQLKMTDLDVVEKYALVVGGNKPRALRKIEGRKAAFCHLLSRREDVYRVLKAMLPFFGERRGAVASTAIQEIEKYWEIVERTGKKPRPEGPAAERSRERGRMWYEKNREKALARNKTWRNKQRKKLNASF